MEVLSWNQQAMAALKQGSFEDSLSLLNKAKTASTDPALAALTHSNLGSYYWAKGESSTALACLRKALHFEQKTGSFLNVAAACLRIAATYQLLGKFSKGLAYSRRAADSLKGRLDDLEVAKTFVLAHYESGKLCELMTDYYEAGKHYLAGLETAEKRLKPAHPIRVALRVAASKLDEKASGYRSKLSRGLAPLRRRQRSVSRSKPSTAVRRSRRANDSFLKELKANVINVKASLL